MLQQFSLLSLSLSSPLSLFSLSLSLLSLSHCLLSLLPLCLFSLSLSLSSFSLTVSSLSPVSFPSLSLFLSASLLPTKSWVRAPKNSRIGKKYSVFFQGQSQNFRFFRMCGLCLISPALVPSRSSTHHPLHSRALYLCSAPSQGRQNRH